MTNEEKLLLQQRRLRAMRDRVATEAYLKVQEVAKHWNVSRSTIEALPIEILRWHDATPTSEHVHRRYSPAEVLAGAVRLRRWKRAKEEGRGEEYLRELRAEMEAEEEAILAFAREIRREVA